MTVTIADLTARRLRSLVATEPISLYTFNTLLQDLRFGYGSALSVIVFATAFAIALAAVRLSGEAFGERSR